MLACTERGDGGAVVLLHGFLGSGRNLGALARSLSGVRTFTIDLPGHGRSPPIDDGGGLDDMARSVVRTLKARGVRRPAVVGHSLGARVGLAMRRVDFELADLAMLDMTPGSLGPTETQSVIEALLAAPESAPSREAMLAHLSRLSRPLVEWLSMNLDRAAGGSVRWRIDRRGLLAFHERHIVEELWPQAEDYAAQTGALLGGRSAYVPAAHAARMRAAGISVDTVPYAGHFVHVEATDHVRAWLEARWRTLDRE